MRKRRYQAGSLNAVRQGNRKVWRLQSYDAAGIRRSRTLGVCSELSRREAEAIRSKTCSRSTKPTILASRRARVPSPNS